MNSEKDENTKMRSFLSDWPRKLISCVVALALFSFVAAKVNNEPYWITVPVTFEVDNGAYEYVVLGEPVTAELKFKNFLFHKEDVNPSDYSITYYITKRNFSAGKKFPLDLRKTRYRVKKPVFAPDPDDEFKLSKYSVNIDPIIERRVTVNVPEKGNLKSGWTVQKTIVPETVMVRGASDLFKNIESVDTLPIELNEGINTDFSTVCQFAPLPDGLSFADKNYDAGVNIDAKVVRSKDVQDFTYTIKNILTLWGNQKNLAIENMNVTECKVTLKMTQKLYKDYKNIGNPVVYLDLSEANTAGSFQAQMKVSNIPPHGMVEVKLEPAFVDVMLINVQPQDEKKKDEAETTEDDKNNTPADNKGGKSSAKAENDTTQDVAL